MNLAYVVVEISLSDLITGICMQPQQVVSWWYIGDVNPLTI